MQMKSGFNNYHKMAIRDHHVCQNFGIPDTCGQIPKSIYLALYLLLSNFPNDFPQACYFLNRMKDG